MSLDEKEIVGIWQYDLEAGVPVKIFQGTGNCIQVSPVTQYLGTLSIPVDRYILVGRSEQPTFGNSKALHIGYTEKFPVRTKVGEKWYAFSATLTCKVTVIERRD